MNELMDRHRGAVILVSALLPLAISAAIAPFRQNLENTNAALLLVVVIVAAASTGIRPAGIMAALSSAVFFDFFLTAPFNSFAIFTRSDVETAVLLLVVGVGVTEIALWGRRKQAQASRERGYLAGVLQTVSAVALRESEPAALTATVADQIQQVLGLDVCRFESGVDPVHLARLHHDGTVSRSGRDVDVARSGLPTDTEIELIVRSGATVHGRYVLTASTGVCRPTLQQRHVAIALADQVGAAMTGAGT